MDLSNEVPGKKQSPGLLLHPFLQLKRGVTYRALLSKFVRGESAGGFWFYALVAAQVDFAQRFFRAGCYLIVWQPAYGFPSQAASVVEIEVPKGFLISGALAPKFALHFVAYYYDAIYSTFESADSGYRSASAIFRLTTVNIYSAHQWFPFLERKAVAFSASLLQSPSLKKDRSNGMPIHVENVGLLCSSYCSFGFFGSVDSRSCTS